MSPTLALPAAKLAVGVAGSLVSGVANALDPAKAKLKKQAEDFETMFLEQMTERLTASTGTDGPLGENGTGGEIWRSQLSQQYARQIQSAGGIGLSDQILRDLIGMQEQAANRTAVATATSTASTNAGAVNVVR